MTIEQLRYFCVVAKFKNISRAADYLYISSSALSRHIASLEESLGVELLVRDGRSIDLTSAGQYVLEKAPALISAADNFRGSVRRIYREQTTTILVACTPMYHASLFDAFRDFDSQCEDHKLLLTPTNTWEVLESVMNGDAELGITYSFEPAQDSAPDLKVFPVLRDRFAVLVNRSHPFSARQSISADELAGEHLLGTRRLGDPNADFLFRIKQQFDRSPYCYVFDTPAKTVLQVKAGNGLAVFPQSLCNEYAAGCSVVPIEDEDAGIDIVAVWRGKTDNPALLKLIGILQSLYGSDKG